MEDIKTKSNIVIENGEVRKILIVEDEPQLLRMYKTKFEKEGFEIYSADDGKPGFNLAKKHHPDIILLDVVLNSMDGFQVLKMLKQDKETVSIPVIILSNLSTNKDIQHGLNNGANDYLIKAHTTPAQLVSKVKEMLTIS